MNCQEFWDRMPEVSDELPHEASEHLGDCPGCAAAWQRRGTLAAGLRRLAVDWRRVEAPARVEAELVSAFRAQRSGRDLPVPLPVRSAWMPLVSGLAAALLVTAGLLILRDRPVAPVRHAPPAAVAMAEAAMDDDTPDSDGFIPLPNAQRISPDEAVNVVRVEVPRSAMLAVGLPVSADQSLELVEADIKMGTDGLARAVRFVNE